MEMVINERFFVLALKDGEKDWLLYAIPRDNGGGHEYVFTTHPSSIGDTDSENFYWITDVTTIKEAVEVFTTSLNLTVNSQ